MNGAEWIVDAHGCRADSLQSIEVLRTLFERIVSELELRTIGETRWHQFPGTGGITGLCLLSESHLACHTFPEYGSLCLNLFCCTPHPAWDFERQLAELFSASAIQVRMITREYESVSELESVSAVREIRIK